MQDNTCGCNSERSAELGVVYIVLGFIAGAVALAAILLTLLPENGGVTSVALPFVFAPQGSPGLRPEPIGSNEPDTGRAFPFDLELDR